ncbi:MAG: hypothetical protein ACYDAG_03555, partial [Chloroflexota bacterium]
MADQGRESLRRAPALPSDLIVTKLCVPPLARGLVPRPELVERMAALLHRRLALISAGAGFGKTTLLREWRSSPGWIDAPVGWISLDAA